MKKIQTTQQLFVESILRVYKKGFGYSKLKIIDNNEFFFGTLAGKEFLDHVNEGDLVEMYLWVEDVVSYEFTVSCIGKITLLPGSTEETEQREGEENFIIRPGTGVLFFKHTDDLVRSETRKCLRAKVNLPVNFFLFDTGDTEKSFSTEEVVFHEGRILELSDREALVKGGDEFPEDSFLKGRLEIQGQEVDIIGKAQAVLVGDEKFFDVSFTGIKDKDRNILLDYVFNEYRE